MLSSIISKQTYMFMKIFWWDDPSIPECGRDVFSSIFCAGGSDSCDSSYKGFCILPQGQNNPGGGSITYENLVVLCRIWLL